MKIIFRKLAKDKSGAIRVECEQPEDFWHIYNLLRIGDVITAVTLRKVHHVTKTGTSTASKVKVKLSLKLDKIDYDTSTCTIRVKGVNVAENKHIALGQSHTTELALHRPFTISKGRWDLMDLQRIKLAADPSKSADLAVVVMQQGLANVLLVTPHMTLTRATIKKTIPRKRRGSSSRHDKALERFYAQVMDAIMKRIDFEVVKCVVVASPAFIKDDFLKYMWEQVAKDADRHRKLLDNKHKFLTAHASGGYKGAVQEILQDPEMQKQLADTKARKDIELLESFFKLLNEDESRAIYGFEYVRKADMAKALKHLMVTDKLFRSADLKERRQYVDLVRWAEKNGANVHIFSSLHTSGEQLDQITGVAAILRFPMPELLELGDDEKEDDDEESEEEESDDSEIDDLV